MISSWVIFPLSENFIFVTESKYRAKTPIDLNALSLLHLLVLNLDWATRFYEKKSMKKTYKDGRPVLIIEYTKSNWCIVYHGGDKKSSSPFSYILPKIPENFVPTLIKLHKFKSTLAHNSLSSVLMKLFWMEDGIMKKFWHQSVIGQAVPHVGGGGIMPFMSEASPLSWRNNWGDFKKYLIYFF